MNRRKRKSTPVVFGGNVSDEVLLIQRQIEEPEEEAVEFGRFINKKTSTSGIQPTGRWNKGSSGAYAPLNHEHPTALISTSDNQQPVENELRFDGGGFLRRRVGNTWEQIPPLASNATPQPTGVAQVGTSLDYSRADHSHPTALLTEGDSQTPVQNELRFKTTNELVRWDGSSWVSIAVDAANVLNLPPSTITVRKNSGSDVGTRPRLNFIEGSNITITVADDSADNEIDITITSTAGGANPSNADPQPTGYVSVGTSTEYSRGDHSHPTAILAQSNSQTPVQNEIRFNTNNKLVRWDGSQWVELSVESTNTPVQVASNYSEQGANDGEIWYRTNDRAFFFRVNNQRVYPAAALHTTGESAVGTGAGNRILLLDSTANNLLRIGGGENQTVFAYPKLPVLAGDMGSTNANWSTGAGTTHAGALWWDTNTASPKFYPNNFGTPEYFYVYRLRYGSGLDIYSFPTNAQDGMVIVRSNGLFVFRTNNGETNFIGYEKTFDIVNECWIPDGTGISLITGSGTVDVRDIYFQYSGSFLNRHLVEFGDASNAAAIILPLGLITLNNSNKTNCTFRVRHQYHRISGSNIEQWGWELHLIRMDSGTNTRHYRLLPSSNTTPTQVGANLFLIFLNLLVNLGGVWEYFENGSFVNNSVPANGTYMVSFALLRKRNAENSPRSTTRHKVIHIQTSLPVNRLPL